LINRLRAHLGTNTGADIDTVIDEQNERIAAANSQIDTLTEDKFELEAQFRQLEAEVGPIKYIAEFVYAEDADKDLLEEAVRWVIVIIIFVFDPLAVLLLIASQYTFRWHKETTNSDLVKVHNPPELDTTIDNSNAGEHKTTNDLKEDTVLHAHSETSSHGNNEFDDEFDYEFENAEPRLKDAMKAWKQENPDSSLKLQRRLLKNGKIDELPWMSYLEPEADMENSVDSDAVEAAKWAQEQIDASKKKESNLDSEGSEQTSNQNSEFIAGGYVQNAEQSQSTIWSKVRK